MSIEFTPTGSEAEDRRIRRLEEAGKLTRIARGVYFRQEGEPLEFEVRRNWQRLVAKLVPGGVITDRSAIETKPVRQVEGGTYNIYVCAPRSRATIDLPGLSIHVRNGAGPVLGDIPFMGTHLAGQERRLLDNLAPSRARGTEPARTLGEAVVEAKLDEWCRTSGTDFLNSIRDRARDIAPSLDREKEFKRLNGMIGTLLNTQQERMVTPQGRARASGTPVDAACLQRFSVLVAYMSGRAPQSVPSADTTAERNVAGAFIEAYFSNYIEGTEFEIEEAAEIVFDGRIPEDRPQDGHDVLGTYLQLVEGLGRPTSATTFTEFKDEIQTRHARLMEARPEIGPGRFKTVGNRAGDTSFVSPDLLEGTLREGHAMMRDIEDPFHRSLFVHYLLTETHPFKDGNGRISRILMTRELASAGLSRIVVPTVFRQDYVDALRALSRRDEPSIFVRSLEYCQKVSAACSAPSTKSAVTRWAQAYAFCEDTRQAKLSMPNPSLEIVNRRGVFAPVDYWEAIDLGSTGFVFDGSRGPR